MPSKKTPGKNTVLYGLVYALKGTDLNITVFFTS
jgi:hypothetical protein